MKHYLFLFFLLFIVACTYKTEKLFEKRVELKVLPKNQLYLSKCLKEDSIRFFQTDVAQTDLTFNKYCFDTIINNTSLSFAFNCIGTSNQKHLKNRFLREINQLFNEMELAAKAEPHKNSCLYYIISDSIKPEKGKLNYTRYYEFCVGGQTIASNSIFLMNTEQLKSILNSKSKRDQSLEELRQYRIKENIFP